MPHDVIMPALGMAQDTGRLVSWLKQPGDAISEGDPLFEVETDKAVMEVAAQADGFLGQVAAEAGDDVPVGSVVAKIADEAAAGQDPAKPDDEKAGQETEASGPDLVEANLAAGQTIIMPALGMTQDTGKLVKWRKSPGDEVSATDILFEVETDKSVMEVEAGHDGYLAACLALEGEEVPVGQPAAVISAAKPGNPVRKSVSDGASVAGAVSGLGDKKPTAETTPIAPPPSLEKPPQISGRRPQSRSGRSKPPACAGPILASPKAKWLAHQQGLDLARLLETDVSQPYHAKDIKVLATLPAPPPHGAGPAPMHIQAKIPASGLEDFVSWMRNDGGIELGRDRIWASFAAGALRSIRKAIDAPLVIEVKGADRKPVRQVDPDRTRLSQPARDDEALPHTLIIRDLGQTDIISVQLGAPEVPIISIFRDGDATSLCLDFTANQLSEDEALAFMGEFAARLKDPLRQLL